MNSFICKQCEKEHNELIQKYGGGYSYLVTVIECSRHNKLKTNVYKSPVPDSLRK
jgi:hypothetical protein